MFVCETSQAEGLVSADKLVTALPDHLQSIHHRVDYCEFYCITAAESQICSGAGVRPPALSGHIKNIREELEK